MEFREQQQIFRGVGISLIVVQNSTSSRNLFENKFKIYPNPTNDIITIVGEKFDEIELHNILGEQIISKTSEKTEINLLQFTERSLSIIFDTKQRKVFNFGSKKLKRLTIAIRPCQRG